MRLLGTNDNRTHISMELPFNFFITDELSGCDDFSKEAISLCLKEVLVEIITSAVYYTGRHTARKIIKETDVKLAIALYLRTQEYAAERTIEHENNHYALYDDEDDFYESDPDSDDSSLSDDDNSTGLAVRKKYYWETSGVRIYDSEDSESDDEPPIDSESEENFRRPDEIATESRWHLNLNYKFVQAAVWQECSTKLDSLTNYFGEFITTLKSKLKNTSLAGGGDGFDEDLSFDNITVFLPLLKFLTWNATLALRGDRRRYSILFD